MIPVPQSIWTILEAIRTGGGRPLLVGGLVRDSVRAAPSKTGFKDFDIEVYGLDEERLTALLERLGKVHKVGRSFGVLKMHLEDGSEVDISLPRRENKVGRGHRGFMVTPDPQMTPREAASRRDFTFNAMAYDPFSGELIDFFNGRTDIERGVLRHASPRFAEDPLRVLRGVQLAGRFNLVADPDTLELARRLLGEYDTLARERIWGEWHKWAARSTVPSAGLTFLKECGWIDCYPELSSLVGCPQEPAWHPEGDVWVHTLHVVDAAARIAQRDGLEGDERAILVLAALTHDLGKPETTVEENGRLRSPGHADCTDTMERFLDSIGVPSRVTRCILVLCRFHLAHLGFSGSKRHVRRLSLQLDGSGSSIPMLGRLVEADQSGRPPLPGGLPESMTRMLEVAREVAVDLAAPSPILGGRHLIREGFEPGPRMGLILDAAFEAQLDGRFEELEGALDWLRVNYKPANEG